MSADYSVARSGQSSEMQAFLLSCLFGAICAMALRAAFSAHATRDRMMRLGGKAPLPEEF